MRPIRAGVPVVLALVTTALLAGCGTTAEDYHATLDKACRDLKTYNDRLPQKQADEDLSVQETTALAQARGRKFLAQLEDMDVPDELESAHGAVVAKLEKIGEQGGSFDTLDEAVTFYEDLSRSFALTGATGCVAVYRTVAAQLSEGAAPNPGSSPGASPS